MVRVLYYLMLVPTKLLRDLPPVSYSVASLLNDHVTQFDKVCQEFIPHANCTHTVNAYDVLHFSFTLKLTEIKTKCTY